MANVDKVLEIFMDGNYFIIFLLLIAIVLIVLVLCLIKSREEYNELLRYTTREDYLDNPPVYEKTSSKEMEVFESMKEDEFDIFSDFDSLKATSEDDIIDENKPLIKQIDIPKIKTYDDVINEYEMNEEECAVISASELERVKKDRMNELGVSDNRQIIEKYEEDQEKKAIISYEQLLKNAQNITLSYVEEEKKEEDAPRINKIEVTQKEVSEPENYLEQEQNLKKLKEFRLSL